MLEDHTEKQIDKYGMRQIQMTKNQIFKKHSEFVNRACVARSGRVVRVIVPLDIRG